MQTEVSQKILTCDNCKAKAVDNDHQKHRYPRPGDAFYGWFRLVLFASGADSNQIGKDLCPTCGDKVGAFLEQYFTNGKDAE